VPFEREQGIIAIHTRAVIDHAHERNATAPNQDVDFARAGVDAVFDQLLHDRSGRSTTSPAATWLATVSGSNRMRLMGCLIL